MGMRTLLLSLASLVVIGFLTPVMATKFAEPQDMLYQSPNGKYTLKITAKTGEHQLCEGDKVLWSFKRRLWYNDYFVSDDGKYVLWVEWQHTSKEFAEKTEAFAVYSADGTVVSKNISDVSELRERRDGDSIGPFGQSMRIWRDKIIKRDGEKVTIKVVGKESLVIDLANPKGED